MADCRKHSYHIQRWMCGATPQVVAFSVAQIDVQSVITMEESANANKA